MSSATVTLIGTPNFSTAFAVSQTTSNISAVAMTYSGGATGTRYIGQLNSVINTFGGGVNYFPGSSPGATATGAQYG